MYCEPFSKVIHIIPLAAHLPNPSLQHSSPFSLYFPFPHLITICSCMLVDFYSFSDALSSKIKYHINNVCLAFSTMGLQQMFTKERNMTNSMKIHKPCIIGYIYTLKLYVKSATVRSCFLFGYH